MIRHEKGQSIVEMALLFPLLLMLLMGVVDLGRAYYVIVSLRDAADEGAAYAAIEPMKDNDIRLRAADATGELVVVDPANVSIDKPLLQAGAPITVTIEYHYDFYMPLVTPLLPEEGITLRGQASHPILRVN